MVIPDMEWSHKFSICDVHRICEIYHILKTYHDKEARRNGIVILLLQYLIFHYFSSAPSEYHLRSVKVMHLLNKKIDIENDQRSDDDK